MTGLSIASLNLAERLTDPAERASVAGFLSGGLAIMISPDCDEDQVDPKREPTVPRGFATDGTWIWSFALGYYVQEHGVAPEADFLAYMRERDYTAAPPDEAARERAARFLDAHIDG